MFKRTSSFGRVRPTRLLLAAGCVACLLGPAFCLFRGAVPDARRHGRALTAASVAESAAGVVYVRLASLPAPRA